MSDILTLSEVVAQTIGWSIGDVVLALFIMFIVIGIIAWKSNSSLAVLLVMGFPFLGATVLVLGNTSAVLAFYALAAVVIGVMVFLAALQLTSKSG